MALDPVAERRKPSGKVREYPAEPDGLRRSATVDSIGLGAIPVWTCFSARKF